MYDSKSDINRSKRNISQGNVVFGTPTGYVSILAIKSHSYRNNLDSWNEKEEDVYLAIGHLSAQINSSYCSNIWEPPLLYRNSVWNVMIPKRDPNHWRRTIKANSKLGRMCFKTLHHKRLNNSRSWIHERNRLLTIQLTSQLLISTKTK
jgi:hypothetical protein